MRKPTKYLLTIGALVVASLGIHPVLAAEQEMAMAPETPTSSCADRSDLLFCEDFENLPLGDAESDGFGTDVEQGSLRVERAVGNGWSDRGGGVLHAHTDGNGRALLVVENFAAPGNSFFGRARIRVEELPTAPDFAHYIFVEATGAQPGSERIRPLGGQFIPTDGGGENRLGIGADGGPTGDWTDHRESAPAVAGRWQCFEWEMDASDNIVTVSIDGVANPDLAVSTRQHGGNDVDFVFPTFDTVKIGWQLFQADPTPAQFDLLLDDIALGTSRIGC